MSALADTVPIAPEPVTSKIPKVFFPNLDGLRFIAFFMVFLQHGFAQPIDKLGAALGLPTTLTRWPHDTGGLGVSFFFVLSGFLITYLILTEVKSTGRLDVIAFYIRRTLRIW